ncbi:hypothetical protein NITMOv2_4709 [Nitrospira moscoviensis]|uniref:Uncharacterized protein n=1 Tax=Nitrospira moscoviensis TaxID=42253 RepID=A0A0K2GJF1_NITMO|nr:hypothetical protein NITMOv2_0072 [Nitrospira moscoviensis]ALA61078.1 hypothetical protein NITMOv2_4709 [Nitrospira moscoviensis]
MFVIKLTDLDLDDLLVSVKVFKRLNHKKHAR